MPQRSFIRIIVITGGLLVLAQALFHIILGYAPITSSASAIPNHVAKLLYWAWFALGFALAIFGLLAVYTSTGIGQGKRYALIIIISIGVTTIVILTVPAVIGIGYPVTGIVGGLLLLSPALWARLFTER